MSIRFKIHWIRPNDGSEFDADYEYIGYANQKGFDLVAWCLWCREQGLVNGFNGGKITLVNPEQYPEEAEKLYKETKEPRPYMDFGFVKRREMYFSPREGATAPFSYPFDYETRSERG